MNTTQENFKPSSKTTLSPIGAVIFAVLATVFSVMCSASLQNSAEQAVLTLTAPLLLFAAGYFATALAVHESKLLFYICAVCSVACSFAATLDILRSLVCIGAFAAALFLYKLCSSAKLTYSGVVCGVIAIYSVALIAGAAVLCYQKYGEISADTLYRAYDSFCNILMKQPREMLLSMQSEFGADAAYQAIIKEYETSVKLLQELLRTTVYFIPSAFLYICAAGAFITVRGALHHRHMQGMANPLGEFSVSIVSAAVYLICYFISIFIDPTSAVGITLNTVSTVPGLGLALFGFLGIWRAVQKHPKHKTLSVVIILALVFLSGMVQSILSLVGAYKTVQIYLIQRAKDKFNNGQDL